MNPDTVNENQHGTALARELPPDPRPETSAASSPDVFDVVMLTTVHSATDVRIFHREARSLAEAGFRVAVVGPCPSKDRLPGVSILELRNPRSRWDRLALGAELLRVALRLKTGLFILHDPELLPAGILLRMFGRKVVFDCHENLLGQLRRKSYLPKAARWFLTPLLWLAVRISTSVLSGFIVATETIGEDLHARRKVLVRNFPPRAILDRASHGLPVQQRRNIVFYSGGLSRDRGIYELTEAFRGLPSNIELWLIGPFYDVSFERRIVGSLPPNVRWFGPRPYSEVLDLLQEAKIGAVLLHNTPNHRGCIPVKLFEYLGAGLPVLASNLPEMAAAVDGCGVQVDPADLGAIRHAVLDLIDDPAMLIQMSEAGRERVLKSYAWEPEAGHLIEFCTGLLPNRSALIAVAN